MHMTMFNIQGDELFAPAASVAAAIFRPRGAQKISAALKMIHCAIVAAKLHRLRNELMLHRNAQARAEFDVSQFPQHPTVLGDKWDF